MRRGHPNKNPGTMRSTSEPRRRRDSGKPAGDSNQAKGCPMAHTAAKRTSESPTSPPPAILCVSDRRSPFIVGVNSPGDRSGNGGPN
jgi:hypothetical protein